MAFGVSASLVTFRGVNSCEAYSGSMNLDGVAVNHGCPPNKIFPRPSLGLVLRVSICVSFSASPEQAEQRNNAYKDAKPHPAFIQNRHFPHNTFVFYQRTRQATSSLSTRDIHIRDS
jgi:hypothetical protein